MPSGYTAQIIEGAASEFIQKGASGRGPASFQVDGQEIWVWPETIRAGKKVRNPVFLAAMGGSHGAWTLSQKQEEYNGRFYLRTYATEFTATETDGTPQPWTGPPPNTVAQRDRPQAMAKRAYTPKKEWKTINEADKYPSFSLSYAKDVVVALLGRSEVQLDAQEAVILTMDIANQFKAWLLDEPITPHFDEPEEEEDLQQDD